MRVVLDGRFIQDHFPGIARYTFDLALALGNLGSDDEFIVLFDPTVPNRRHDIGRLISRGGVTMRPIVAPTFSLSGLVRLTWALRLIRPDVYHSPYLLRTPASPGFSVVTIFDLIAERPDTHSRAGLRSRLRRAIFHYVVGLAVRTSTRVIVPSEATASDLTARHSIARRKLEVIPLGVDPMFRPVGTINLATLRVRYRLPKHFILCVAINKPHKNLVTLVRALDHPSAKNVVLVVAGAVDPRYPTAVQIARACGVEGRVIGLGF